MFSKKQLRKAFLGFEEMESRRVMSAHVLAAVAADVASSAALVGPTISVSAASDHHASHGNGKGSIHSDASRDASSTSADTGSHVGGATPSLVTQVSATASAAVTDTLTVTETNIVTAAGDVITTLVILSGSDSTSGSGTETVVGTQPAAVSTASPSSTETVVVAPSGSAFTVVQPNALVENLVDSPGTSGPTLIAHSIQNSSTGTAAFQNGQLVTSMPPQTGLVAFPIFATGLNQANYQMILSQPATSFADNVLTRIETPRDYTFHRELNRDLSVPMLEWHGQFGSAVREPETRGYVAGIWEEALPERLPQAMGLLGDASVLDRGLDQALRQFLDNLEDLGQGVAHALLRQGWLPWAVGAAAAGAVALEARRVHRRARVRAAAGQDDENAITWIPGLPGLLSVEEP